jgi:hypothetical protein
MYSNSQLYQNSIVFRRWTRKAYAVFSSLGKQITIGHLTSGISEASLCKLETPIHSICYLESKEELKDEELQEEPVSYSLFELILLLCVIMLTPIVSSLSCKLRIYSTVKLSVFVPYGIDTDSFFYTYNYGI